MKNLQWVCAICLSLSLAGVTLAAPGKLLYRYVDDRGKIVLNDQLPPEAAKSGYDVLRRDGTLVERVAGSASAEELQKMQRLRMREEEAERLRKWDEGLLLRYSSIDDIQAAKNRALDEIRVRVVILKGNMRNLKRQVEQEQEDVADLERALGDVPKERVERIRNLKWRIADVEEMLDRREQELQEVSVAYDQDIKRFETLVERIGKRR